MGQKTNYSGIIKKLSPDPKQRREEIQIDYEKVIRQLSSAYDKKGRLGHDELLDSLRIQIGEKPYKIISRILIEEYFKEQRIFGAFAEKDIKNLTVRCRNLESSSTFPQ